MSRTLLSERTLGGLRQEARSLLHDLHHQDGDKGILPFASRSRNIPNNPTSTTTLSVGPKESLTRIKSGCVVSRSKEAAFDSSNQQL
jgi:hypothetical protein